MNGKERCRFQQRLWKTLAEVHDIPYEPIECYRKEPCCGLCPRCDAVISYLRKALVRKERAGKLKLEEVPFRPGIGADLGDWFLLLHQVDLLFATPFVRRFCQTLSVSEQQELKKCLQEKGLFDEDSCWPYFRFDGKLMEDLHAFKKGLSQDLAGRRALYTLEGMIFDFDELGRRHDTWEDL